MSLRRTALSKAIEMAQRTATCSVQGNELGQKSRWVPASSFDLIPTEHTCRRVCSTTLIHGPRVPCFSATLSRSPNRPKSRLRRKRSPEVDRIGSTPKSSGRFLCSRIATRRSSGCGAAKVRRTHVGDVGGGSALDPPLLGRNSLHRGGRKVPAACLGRCAVELLELLKRAKWCRRVPLPCLIHEEYVVQR